MLQWRGVCWWFLLDQAVMEQQTSINNVQILSQGVKKIHYFTLYCRMKTVMKMFQVASHYILSITSTIRFINQKYTLYIFWLFYWCWLRNLCINSAVLASFKRQSHDLFCSKYNIHSHFWCNSLNIVLKVEPDQYQSIGQYRPFTGTLVSAYMWSDMHQWHAQRCF